MLAYMLYTLTIYATYIPDKKRQVCLKAGQLLNYTQLIHPKYRLCKSKSTLLYISYICSLIYSRTNAKLYTDNLLFPVFIKFQY